MNNKKKSLRRARTRLRMVTDPLRTAVVENFSCEGGEGGSSSAKMKKLGRTYNISGTLSIHHNGERKLYIILYVCL